MKIVEQLAKQYKILQLLDKQIVAIEKMAMQLASDENIINISIDIEKLVKEEEYKEKDPEEAGIYKLMMGSYIWGATSKKESIKEINKFKLDTKTSLMVLEVIIHSLSEKRNQIVKYIQEQLKEL